MKKHEKESLHCIDIKEVQSIMLEILKQVHDICEKHHITYVLTFGTLLGAIRHNGMIPWDDDIDIMMPRQDYLRFKEIIQHELGNDYFFQTPETDRNFDILHVPVKIRDHHSTLIEEWNKNYHQGIFIDIFILDYINEKENDEYYALKKRMAFLSSLKMRISWKEQHGVKKLIRILLQLLFKLIPARCIYRYQQKQIAALRLAERDPKDFKYFSYGPEYLDAEIDKIEYLFPLKVHAFEQYKFYIPNNSDIILKHQYGNYMELPDEDDRIAHGLFYSNQRYD